MGRTIIGELTQHAAVQSFCKFLCRDADHCFSSPAVCVRALDVTVSQSSVQVARGQAAVLPCSFTTSAALNNLNIIWMVIPLSNANLPEQVCITHIHLLTALTTMIWNKRKV